MALNTKGKKTSLTEEASIYQKRQDDLSDKERIKNMTGKQKRDFFRTYYLPKLLVILAVAGVVFTSYGLILSTSLIFICSVRF